MTPSAAQFVDNLLRATVTPARVARVMARIAGPRVEVGPLKVGPGGAVTVSGVGVIGPIDVTPSAGESPAFVACIPADLSIELSLGSARRTYLGTVLVPLHIQVVLEAPAHAYLFVPPLRPADVAVKLHTEALDTFVLQTLGNADQEIAEQVAAVVNERVSGVADLRRLDLVDLVDRGWDGAMEARLSA